MKDSEHPFFRPLWRRVAIVAVCAIWTGIEYYNGDQFWTTITVGMTLYAAWTYLYAYRPPQPVAEEPPPTAEQPSPPADKEKE